MLSTQMETRDVFYFSPEWALLAGFTLLTHPVELVPAPALWPQC